MRLYTEFPTSSGFERELKYNHISPQFSRELPVIYTDLVVRAWAENFPVDGSTPFFCWAQSLQNIFFFRPEGDNTLPAKWLPALLSRRFQSLTRDNIRLVYPLIYTHIYWNIMTTSACLL